ncbi:hypothetical protein SLG_22320 [Sphingobium sp. SYK-6]|uniref:hypothetical protein n=1 Tax=Sphingobium sp. (strain NBRC 103272 / SYK-6) TaxID=627192 RepID=UPI0002277147|nr:hypothetical protein [Sphingobium sp. SYK-6]BAK66907.1 hypothetical protein SLG_22320 [Sphingobium sp. SYK-6]
MRAILILAVLGLTACARTVPTPPATQIKIVREVVEVPRPCNATKPKRPEPMARPLPTDLRTLVALLAAKLEEYSGPGKFADRIEGALDQCTKE